MHLLYFKSFKVSTVDLGLIFTVCELSTTEIVLNSIMKDKLKLFLGLFYFNTSEFLQMGAGIIDGDLGAEVGHVTTPSTARMGGGNWRRGLSPITTEV